jgi:hypothetical protein
MSTSPPAGRTRPAASYDRDEMIALLTAAARVAGTHSMAAAMHLLTYTELPGSRDFARHVDVQADRAADGSPVTGAWVRDWDALLGDDSGVYLTGGDRRMLAIAASYAAGRPVDLREHGHGFGTAHARRVVEAAAIGAGMGEYLTIADGPALEQMRARQDALFGDVGADREGGDRAVRGDGNWCRACALALRGSLRQRWEALCRPLFDPLLARRDKKIQQFIAEARQADLACPVCGRACDDVDGTIVCMSAHVATAADMHAELNDLIRAVEDRDH